MINGLTDYNHPTQVVCDLLTMSEHLPQGRRLQDCTVVFVGDRTNVCSSLMFIATQFGMRFIHAAPAEYQAPERVGRRSPRRTRAAPAGRCRSPRRSRRPSPSADFIYTDLWWWVDQEDQIPERRAAFMPRYQVNARSSRARPRTPSSCTAYQPPAASRSPMR